MWFLAIIVSCVRPYVNVCLMLAHSLRSWPIINSCGYTCKEAFLTCLLTDQSAWHLACLVSLINI